MTATRLFALTPGEPAGIGPDLCLLLAREAQPHALVAIASQDFAIVRAMVFLGSVLYIVSNILIDVAYTLADPRVRMQ